MIIFWILAAGLTTLALSFIILPLWRQETSADAPVQDALNLSICQQRLKELDADLAAGFLDQDQYAAARRDLERDLLHDLDEQAAPELKPTSAAGRWALASVLSVMLPLAAVLLYLTLGNQDILPRLDAAASGQAQPATTEQNAPPIEDLVKRMEARLAKNPANLDGWLMLGRTYFAINDMQKGLDAITKAYELAPHQTEVMLAYAEALATSGQGKRLDGKPAELIQAALAQEPANPNARWLSGMILYQHGQYQDALDIWQKIFDELEPGSEEAKNLREMIDEARGRVGQQAVSADSVDQPDQKTAASDQSSAKIAGGTLNVTVRLDPALTAQTTPDQTVFIFARAVSGPPMPLAVQRLRVQDLPRTVTLDDSLAMSPALRLSAFAEVMVGARISLTGQATAQRGDFEGQTEPVHPGDTASVTVTIDHVRP